MHYLASKNRRSAANPTPDQNAIAMAGATKSHAPEIRPPERQKEGPAMTYLERKNRRSAANPTPDQDAIASLVLAWAFAPAVARIQEALDTPRGRALVQLFELLRTQRAAI